MGKTTLVQQFLGQVRAAGSLWVGHGQCSESTGPGEAYLPLLEALGRLGQAPDGARLVAALRRAAPTWLVQLPLLLEASELATLQHQVHGASRDRMLRELVDALLLLTAERPLALVLEDLHWSDPSTAEWLAYVARRPDRLRLLVLGTCRPAEVIARGHPLRQIVQGLAAHQLCQEVRLELLTGAEVQAYVAQRFGPGPQSTAIGAMVHARTDGNALFMAQVLDYLVQRRLMVQEGEQWVLQGGMAAVGRVLPDELRALIEQQVEALEPEAQQCLAVASVAGEEFTAAVVAAGLQGAVEAVERVCDGLHQQGQFLAEQELAAWPDGTVTARYTFRHAVYREVVYERLGQAQRVRWHRRVGECLEAGYGRRTQEVASTLALHFERGRDVGRAVQYRRAAVEQALARSAYAEAGEHCRQGLALLETLPVTPERTAQELALRTDLSTVLSVTHGYAAPVLEENLQRARVLCQEVEATVELVPILVGLSRLSMIRSDRAATEVLLEQDRHLLERVHDAASLVLLHTQLGIAETFRGAHARAEEHYTQTLALYDPAAHRSLLLVYGEDPAVNALGVFGLSLWLTGRPEQAWSCVQRAVAYAETLAQPFALISALFDAVVLHQLRGDLDTAWALSERLVALGREQSFVLYETGGVIIQGCILLQRGDVAHGMALLTTGLAQHRNLGAQLHLPFFLSFLAEAHLRCDQVEDGLHVIHEALRLTATNFDCFWEAELHRLRGALLLAQAGTRLSTKGLSRRGSSNVLPAGPRRRPPAGGESVGVAGRHEPQSLVASARAARRGADAAR